MKTGVFGVEWNYRSRDGRSHENWVFMLMRGVVPALELAMLRCLSTSPGFPLVPLEFSFLDFERTICLELA